MQPGEPELTEDEAIPANPDNEYGWEKLYAERVAMAYARRYGLIVRIARFENCYGPEGTWTGGREKAQAAICRKVAEAENGGTIEVWGDGTAIRVYTYVDDMQEIIETVEALPSEDQFLLIDIIRQRLLQQRRAELAAEMAEARQAYPRGEVRRGTVADLMQELVA